MQRVLILVVALIALGAIGAAVYFGIQKRAAPEAGRSPAVAPVAAATLPPANAEFLDPETTADGVMLAVSSMRKEPDQKAAEAGFVGLWVPAEGWEAEIVDVTEERSGTALRMYVTTGGITGGYYIVAVVAGELDDIRKGDRAAVQGRIDKVEVLPGGAIPIHRIVLNPAKVVRHTKFGR